jgi:malonyl-CoA O-methyltransferase
MAAHPRTRFSAAAGTYDRFAHVQQAVADRLLRTLVIDRRPARVLDIGCGTGMLTRRLADLWPDAWVEGVDWAPGMIDQARRHRDQDGRPLFTLADATTYEGTPSHVLYDQLVSASSLQWMPPLDRTLEHLAGLLRPGGHFAFALMLDETLDEIRAAEAAVVTGLPKAVVLPSFAEVEDALAAAGLIGADASVEEHVVHAPSAAALLRELHDVGATASLHHGRPNLTRRQLLQLCEHYDAHFRDAAGVVATYRVGFFVGVRR